MLQQQQQQQQPSGLMLCQREPWLWKNACLPASGERTRVALKASMKRPCPRNVDRGATGKPPGQPSAQPPVCTSLCY